MRSTYSFDIDSVIDNRLLNRIPPQPQYQGALEDQLKALAVIANRFGLYDAGSYLHRLVYQKPRFAESEGRIVVESDERPIAIYDHVSNDERAKIFRRGSGFYGTTGKFDFRAANETQLRAKLRGWGYVVHAAGVDLLS